MQNIQKFRKRNVFQKYLEVFFTRLKLGLTEMKEYPSNNIAGLISNFSLMGTYIIFYFVFAEIILFKSLNWEKYDFIVLFMLLLTYALFLRFFSLSDFQNQLLRGELNNYLVRPINPYSIASTKNLRGSIILNFLIFLGLTIFVLIYGNYSNYIFAFIIGSLGFITHTLIINNIFSLSFFMKKGDIFYDLYYKQYFTTIESYTPKMFENTLLKHIVYLTPASFIGFFIIEVLKGRFELVLQYLLPFIFLTIVSLLLLIVQWHYGLKKYEAFG